MTAFDLPPLLSLPSHTHYHLALSCLVLLQAPTPNVLQWLFLNNIGTWDPASVSAMLKSAALFNRHKNGHFLSLVPKFQNKERQRKALIETALVELDAPIDPKNIHSNTRRGAAKHQNILLDNSANDGSTATRGPPVSTEPALKDTRLPTLEKRPSISTGNTDNVALKVCCTSTIAFSRKSFFLFVGVFVTHPPNSEPLRFHFTKEEGHVGDCYGSNWLCR